MARRHELIYALNAGGVDKDALSRVDLDKMRLAGEHPVANFLPQVLGPMGLRPGLGHKSRIAGDAVTRLVPFIINSSSGYELGFSHELMTPYLDGVAVTVSNSSSVITNPAFANGGGGWSDVSASGAGTDPTFSMSTGKGIFTAVPYRSAEAQQTVGIAAGDRSTAHTVRVVVERGPIYFRVGSSSGEEDVFGETELRTGVHKLTFTPGTGTIYLRFRADDTRERIVTTCQFEHTALGGAGTLTLPTEFQEGNLPDLAWDQSASVLYVADGVHVPKRVEYRGAGSWSITTYQTRIGPFSNRSNNNITLTPTAIGHGNGTLTANVPIFKPTDTGTLWELTHDAQFVGTELNGASQVTNYVTVDGVFRETEEPNDRDVAVIIDFVSGGFSGTISLQRSLDADALVWHTVKDYASGGGNISEGYNDNQSNLLAHYRLAVTSYSSGSASINLNYLGGSKTGLLRLTAYNSATSFTYEVVKPMGQAAATRNWRRQVWSQELGWPRVPRFFDGRLWWFRGDVAYGTVVDDFTNYDDTVEGDSAPVIRSIGAGAVEGAQWALDMQRLIVGTTGYEASIRASSFDEPITPTAFTARNASTLGSSRVPAVKVDRGLFFVHRSGRRLYEMLYSIETNDYTSQDATRINPGALNAIVKAMGVQRYPDTRVYLVLNDGTCVVLTWERDDKVYAYTTIATSGFIEDVCVVPGSEQDYVYFVVRRVIQSTNRRFIERLANESDQRSKSTCALLDAHTVVVGSGSSISGATHLAGRTVQVWADGRRIPDVTLDSSGNAALGSVYTSRLVYGLGYTASFKSVKLAYAAQLGTAVGQEKRIANATAILSNSCLDGIRIGKDAGSTDPMPAIVNGAPRTTNQFFAHYDHSLYPIASDWDTDSRIYVGVDSAEGPVTIQSIVLDVETREAISQKRDD